MVYDLYTYNMPGSQRTPGRRGTLRWLANLAPHPQSSSRTILLNFPRAPITSKPPATRCFPAFLYRRTVSIFSQLLIRRSFFDLSRPTHRDEHYVAVEKLPHRLNTDRPAPDRHEQGLSLRFCWPATLSPRLLLLALALALALAQACLLARSLSLSLYLLSSLSPLLPWFVSHIHMETRTHTHTHITRFC